MFDEETRAVLMRPVIVRLTTIRPNGYPHTVPVWFLLEGDDLLVFSYSESRKVKNVRANPKGNISLGGDPVGSPCLTIEGDFEIEDDPEHAVTARITRHYESPEQAEAYLREWEHDPHVILRLKPRRVVKVGA